MNVRDRIRNNYSSANNTFRLIRSAKNSASKVNPWIKMIRGTVIQFIAFLCVRVYIYLCVYFIIT